MCEVGEEPGILEFTKGLGLQIICSMHLYECSLAFKKRMLLKQLSQWIMNTTDFEPLQTEFQKLVGAHPSLNLTAFRILNLDIMN